MILCFKRISVASLELSSPPTDIHGNKVTCCTAQPSKYLKGAQQKILSRLGAACTEILENTRLDVKCAWRLYKKVKDLQYMDKHDKLANMNMISMSNSNMDVMSLNSYFSGDGSRPKKRTASDGSIGPGRAQNPSR